ncbi:MAG: hypothetical protein N2C14_30755 [Planctomycetales bacterium]
MKSEQSPLREVMMTNGGVLGKQHGREAVTSFGDVPAEYSALTNGCGLVDVSDRSRIQAAGKDRASFLHNICSNDVKSLAPGDGCEAFFLDAKGHVLGHVVVRASEESILLETSGGQAELLIGHLDRYVIMEQVELTDVAAASDLLLVAGPRSRALLAELVKDALPSGRLASAETEISGVPVVVGCSEIEYAEAGHADSAESLGFTLTCSRENVADIWNALRESGAKPCGRQSLEIVRVESGFPLYGVDVTDKNLPQEVARNEQAISLTKGCYIGQETVARIDALGHVNRALAGLRFESSDPPPAGTELQAEGKTVGQVTSSAWSPRLEASAALGYVRRGFTTPGVQLQSAAGPAEVVGFPIR